MTVGLTSRYADGHYSRNFPDPRRYAETRFSRGGFLGPYKQSVPVIVRTTKSPATVASYYIWSTGDRWDLVAARLGIPKTEWWRILDCNPHIEFPTSVKVGDVIAIPSEVPRYTQ